MACTSSLHREHINRGILVNRCLLVSYFINSMIERARINLGGYFQSSVLEAFLTLPVPVPSSTHDKSATHHKSATQ